MNGIAMTTLQKTIVTAAAVVLTGAGIYEARQVATLREQVQTLQQKLAIPNQSQESEGGQLNLSAIKEKLPETVTPLTPDQSATKEPHSYEFGTGSGGRVWQRIDAATWHEVYPDGFTSIFKVLGHAKVGDTEGTLAAKVAGELSRTGTPNDGTLQAFIPDIGSERMHHLFRYNSGGDMSWHDLAEMNKVQ